MVRIPKNGIEKKKQPSFFKIIFPSYSTEHLRIPPKFLRHIDCELSNSATLKLKQSSEYSWTVKVIKSGRDVYFKDGWQEFLRDTSLGDKEFLVFIYNGKMCFSVKIFDKNACERMDFSDIKTHQTSRSSKRQPGRPRKSSEGEPAHKRKEVKEKEHDYTNTGKSTSKSTERPTKTTSESTKRPRGRPRKHTVTCSDHLRPSNSCQENSAAGKHILNSEFDVLNEVKEEEEDYQESAELFKSNFQYFTLKILRLSQVYVAKPFYKENFSSGKYEFVFLKISDGTKWYQVKLSGYRDMAFLTKGWRAFALANQVKRIPPKLRCEPTVQKSDTEFEAILSVHGMLKVRKSGRDVYFKDWWQEFFRDNSLGDRVLSIHLPWEMRFSVKILHTSGCERMDFRGTKNHQTPEFLRVLKDLVVDQENVAKAIWPINSTDVKEEEEDYNTKQTQESAELFKSKFPHFTTTI